MDSELQIALVGLGIAAVVGVLIFNKWQDRRDQRQAEQSFRRDTHDVLLDPKPKMSDDKRSEPVIGDVASSEVDDEVVSIPPPSVVQPERKQAKVSERHKAPGVPDRLDPRIDCIVLVESIELLEVPRLWTVQQQQLSSLNKLVRWFGFDDRENAWRELGPHSGSAHHWFCVAMQMVDRRGIVDVVGFQAFTAGVQHVADQFLAVPADMPSRADAMARATSMDQFCASVDIQVGINVVATGPAFPGTKIRALAEAAGMTLGDDGAFHALDDNGQTLFTLSNLESALFAVGEMRNINSKALTLLIDVPLVSDGVAAFSRMLRLARQMADTLQGEVVDDNRRPFSDEDAQLVRDQIRHYQGEMAKAELPSGGALAQRLFSA